MYLDLLHLIQVFLSFVVIMRILSKEQCLISGIIPCCCFLVKEFLISNEIYHSYPEGNTLYALIRQKSDDKVNIQGTNNFEAWVDGNVGTYDHPMADQDGGYYSVDFPTSITGTDLATYRITIVLQAGGSPSADGTVDIKIAQGEIHWDGSEEVGIESISISNNTVINRYDESIPAIVIDETLGL